MSSVFVYRTTPDDAVVDELDGEWSEPIHRDDESWWSLGRTVHGLAPDGWFRVFVVACEEPEA